MRRLAARTRHAEWILRRVPRTPRTPTSSATTEPAKVEPGSAAHGLRQRRLNRLDPLCEDVPEEKKENARCAGVQKRPHTVGCAAQTAERQAQENGEAGDRAEREDLAHRHRGSLPLPVRYSPRGRSSFGRPNG